MSLKFVAIVSLILLIRLEIKLYNLKIGKHYILYTDNGMRYVGVRYINEDGSLNTTLYAPPKMTYSKAKAIKNKYPEVKMVNTQTGVEGEPS